MLDIGLFGDRITGECFGELSKVINNNNKLEEVTL